MTPLTVDSTPLPDPSRPQAVLVDAGTGNLHSVYNALLNLGFRVQVTSQPADIASAGRVILPGVGAYGKFMDGLAERGLVEPLRAFVQAGLPLLGICVGMQALFERSEEMGIHPGLALLPGKVIRFPQFTDRKVPHTGWNQLWQAGASPLLAGLPEGAYAYFNHSFYCQPAGEADTAARTDYGLPFCSVVARARLYGVQFHPEKSQTVGLQILRNFMERC